MSCVAISPFELEQLYKSGKPFDLIDVSTPVEFRELHVEFARNIPLDRLDPAAFFRERTASATDPVYFVCPSGTRSQLACETFHKAGYTIAQNIAGGTSACESAALPLVRGKKAISLERQVRIAAGSLVLTGIILGWLVHPYFIGLSAFVGAGLVFAGVTNTCGMGLLLAQMPWNKVAPAPTPAPTQCSIRRPS